VVVGGLLFLGLQRALNILARSRAELAGMSERLGLLAQGVREYAFIDLSPEGIVLSWNPGARRIKGYESPELLGRHHSCFYTPEDLAAGEPARLLREAAADGQCAAEGWRVRRDGSRFWASVVVTALRDRSGRLQGFAKITRDLTERRRAEESLREANERLAAQAADLERRVAERTKDLQESNEDLQTFAHTLSHDLRAPLRAMQGFSDALLEDCAERLDDTGSEYARRIAAAARKLDTILQDLLQSNRMLRSSLTPEPVEAEGVIAAALEAAAESLRARGAEVQVESPMPAILGHHATLVQLIGNLVDNAAKYVAPDL
jgi:PAS domain S-box-containing protein